jgi:alcohol dehydrogenase
VRSRGTVNLMRAAVITSFGQPLEILDVPDPVPTKTGVVLKVEASGICRSDWHAWMGHEHLPGLPHVPGHEMAGTIEAVGEDVRRWKAGERVTVPFSIGCGECNTCLSGQLNLCDRPFTPGFTHWGSFAELVSLDHADSNLVALPEDFDSAGAAALGCRFITAFRGVIDKGRIQAGEWLAVHGCGGVGLSAVMIGSAMGANVVAIDISSEKLALASELGAKATVDASEVESVTRQVRGLTDGGAHLSIDALGSTVTAVNSVRSLRKQGRHIQVGLMPGEASWPPLPMDAITMRELEVHGSRGMPATDYPRVLALISSGAVDPSLLVKRRVTLQEAPEVLADMSNFAGLGIAVITSF